MDLRRVITAGNTCAAARGSLEPILGMLWVCAMAGKKPCCDKENRMLKFGVLAEKLLPQQGFLGAATRVPCFAIFGVFNLGNMSLYLGDIGIFSDDDVWLFERSFWVS